MSRFIQQGLVGLVVLVVSLGASLAGAATFVWTGVADGNWSNGANWTNGAPPASAGTDNVWLTPGVFAPVNQDIPGLYIDTLNFTNNVAGYTVGGSAIALKNINSFDDGGIFRTNTINCNLVLARNWDSQINSKTVLWINGSVGETNGSFYIHGYTGGYFVLAGSNTFSGGLDLNAVKVKFFNDQNLGAVPVTTMSSFFNGSVGAWIAANTGAFNRITVNAKRGLRGSTLVVESNAKLVFSSPIVPLGTMTTFGGVYNSVAAQGTFLLYGDASNLTGNIHLDQGVLVLMHSNALGGTATGNLEIGGGAAASYDFHGFDCARGFSAVGNGSGFDQSGVIKNNDTQHISTFSGNVGLSFNSSMPFGGAGDIIMSGVISSSGSGKFLKTGSGTLILKGANTYTAESDIRLGGLTLDYTLQNNDKIGTNYPMYLAQAALKLIGNDSSDSLQQMGSLMLGGEVNIPSGANSVTLRPGSNRNLTLAAQGLVVASQNAVDFRVIPNGAGVAQITTTNADGLLGGISATWSGYSLAKIVGGVVTGMADGEYLTTFVGGTTSTHVDVPAGSTTLSSSATEQTLRFNEVAGSALTIASGKLLSLNGLNGSVASMRPGIMMTTNAGPVSINGPGGIEPGHNQVFMIQQYSASPLTIAAQISGQYLNMNWWKGGPGELVLSGTNSNTGDTFIYGGTLTATTLGSNGVSCSIGQGQQIYMANSTFKYTGAATAHNRQINVRGPATLDAAGSGLLEFTTATNVLLNANIRGSDFPLTLTGSGSGQMDGVLDLHLGSVIKDGPGTWTLCGTQYYTGNTIVSNGTLRLSNNCVLARSLTVAPSGTLAGSATVQEDLVMNGTRRVEIRSDSDYDTLTVGYDITLGGTLDLVEMNGYKMPANMPMTILSAGGTVTGAFATVSGGFTVTPSADGRQLLLSKSYPGFIFYVR